MDKYKMLITKKRENLGHFYYKYHKKQGFLYERIGFYAKNLL